MAITWANVVEIASEQSTIPVATQSVLLAIVDRQVDADIWGDMADDGRCYLAAHLGYLYAASASAAGPVTSESLGPMSRSYGDTGGSESDLATSKYGRFYLYMQTLLPSAMGFVP